MAHLTASTAGTKSSSIKKCKFRADRVCLGSIARVKEPKAWAALRLKHPGGGVMSPFWPGGLEVAAMVTAFFTNLG